MANLAVGFHQSGNKRVLLGILFQLINRFQVMPTLSRGEGALLMPVSCARNTAPRVHETRLTGVAAAEPGSTRNPVLCVGRLRTHQAAALVQGGSWRRPDREL